MNPTQHGKTGGEAQLKGSKLQKMPQASSGLRLITEILMAWGIGNCICIYDFYPLYIIDIIDISCIYIYRYIDYLNIYISYIYVSTYTAIMYKPCKRKKLVYIYIYLFRSCFRLVRTWIIMYKKMLVI